MASRGRRIPSYRLHKNSGQARVTIQGRDYFLGKFDSEESRKEYARIIAEYLASEGKTTFDKPVSELCVGHVLADYLDHCKGYFGDSTEGKNVKRAMAPVAELYSDLPVDEFGPLQFKAVRTKWTEVTTRSRGYCNAQMKRVLRFLKWGVGEGKIPAKVIEECRCVAPLKKGKCGLADTEPIQPVSMELVESTLPHLTKVVADMVRFQLATACRPGEVVKITPAMVDQSGEVWEIKLDQHKTAFRGKKRVLYVGPKGQVILRPYLTRRADKPCFSPAESERQRLDAKHAARVVPLSCGNRPGKNTSRRPKRHPGESFITGSYTNSIRYACNRAKLKHWSPLQLRHTAATLVRRQFGIEGAQVILGHSELTVTQVYAEADRAKAIRVAKKIG
jgi:integrase